MSISPRGGVGVGHGGLRLAAAGVVLIVLLASVASLGYWPTEAVTRTKVVTSTVTVTVTPEGVAPGPNATLANVLFVCFSPAGDCGSLVARLVMSANSTVYVMVYLITLDELADALISASKRGVLVRVVVERDNIDLRGSDVKRLARAGVPVRADTNTGLMHHKVAVIDERLVVTGSMNWSLSGSERNNENVLVLESRLLAKLYIEEFTRVWDSSTPVTP